MKPKALTLTNSFDKFFKSVLVLVSLSVFVIVLAFFFTLLLKSMPAIRHLGWSFIWGKTWDPVSNEFGVYPFLVGTLLTSFIALIVSIPFSFAITLFLGEYFPKGAFSSFLKTAIELMAAIPSVVYGLWAMFVIVPLVRDVEMAMQLPPYGVGIFTASFILSIMIIPFSASIGKEVLSMVPLNLKEAAYSLGATRYEVIRYVVFPYTWSGLFAGILLSLGRALGETMAVTMLIGNATNLPQNIFSPGNTMASVIANEFTEATGDIYPAVLIEMGLALFIVTFIINLFGKLIISRINAK